MAAPPETWSEYRPRPANYSLLGGLGGGIGAFVASFLGVAIAAGNGTFDLERAVRGFTFAVEHSPDSMQALELVFFEAHHVGSTARIVSGGATEVHTVPVRETATWEGLLVAIPIVALVIAGYLVVSIVEAWDARSAVEAGASIAVGYSLLVIPFAVLPTIDATLEGTSVTVGPDPLLAIVIAGIVYPVVLGGIGGAIAGVVGN